MPMDGANKKELVKLENARFTWGMLAAACTVWCVLLSVLADKQKEDAAIFGCFAFAAGLGAIMTGFKAITKHSELNAYKSASVLSKPLLQDEPVVVVVNNLSPDLFIPAAEPYIR